MRRKSSWIVLSIVIAAVSGSERSIAAQRPQPTRSCGGKTSPHEIEAHGVFRERFERVALEHFAELELQPSRPRGRAPTGRPPLAMEEMEWRQGTRYVRIQYSRLATVEDATTRLCWRREMIPLQPPLVEGFADEAYGSPFSTPGSGNLFYRRGQFVFTVVVRLESDVNNRADSSVPRLIINPAIDIARVFLAATDAVLAAESK
jgi:hypothetical protein